MKKDFFYHILGMYTISSVYYFTWLFFYRFLVKKMLVTGVYMKSNENIFIFSVTLVILTTIVFFKYAFYLFSLIKKESENSSSEFPSSKILRKTYFTKTHLLFTVIIILSNITITYLYKFMLLNLEKY